MPSESYELNKNLNTSVIPEIVGRQRAVRGIVGMSGNQDIVHTGNFTGFHHQQGMAELPLQK